VPQPLRARRRCVPRPPRERDAVQCAARNGGSAFWVVVVCESVFGGEGVRRGPGRGPPHPGQAWCCGYRFSYSETKPWPVFVPFVVPPLFGLSADVHAPLSVVCVALLPWPVVVVQVPVSKVLPCDGFTAPAGAASHTVEAPRDATSPTLAITLRSLMKGLLCACRAARTGQHDALTPGLIERIRRTPLISLNALPKGHM
jgi:hypothetical protein